MHTHNWAVTHAPQKIDRQPVYLTLQQNLRSHLEFLPSWSSFTTPFGVASISVSCFLFVEV